MVDSHVAELSQRTDTLDSSIIGWWRKSVRSLQPQAALVQSTEPKIWAKIQLAWFHYAEPAGAMSLEVLIDQRINRMELIHRLNSLRAAARAA